MESIFRDVKDLDVYIDNIGVFSNSWDAHLSTLDHVLRLLKDNEFMINPLKSQWVTQETDWLGYWFTHWGIKTWKKKVDVIIRMQHPQTQKNWCIHWIC